MKTTFGIVGLFRTISHKMGLKSAHGLPNGLLQCHFSQHSKCVGLLGRLCLDRRGVRLLPQLVQKLQAQRSTCPFVTVDCRGHEDEVRTEKFSNERKGNCCGFVYYHELGLAKLVCVCRVYILEKVKIILIFGYLFIYLA